MRTAARVTLRDGLLELSITGREAVAVGRAGDDAADAVDRRIVSLGLVRVTPWTEHPIGDRAFMWTFDVDEVGAPFGVMPPGRWYPQHPPRLPLESADDYTNRLLAGGVYDHRRGRQCSIGWHAECSDPSGLGCQCPCHREEGGHA